MILVGVTGSIAAYKAAEVVRLFVKAGQDVHVVMTPAATQFVGALTFQSLSGHPVLTEALDPKGWQAAHLDLPERARAVVVVPATAECLSRLARGSASDIVGICVLSTPRSPEGSLKAPVFVAPAMHEVMWRHPATQENVRVLKTYGYELIGPVHGALSRAGDEGEGRLAEPSAIAEKVLQALAH